MKTMVLLQAVLIAALSGAGEVKTPETSSLFLRHVDPDSEVVSYILKPGLVADNQQSLYFTAKSLTDDGRFLVFSTSANEFVKVNGKPPSKRKSMAVVDFLKDEAIRLDDMVASTPFIDVKTDTVILSTNNVFLEWIAHNVPGCFGSTHADKWIYYGIDDRLQLKKAWSVDLKGLRSLITQEEINFNNCNANYCKKEGKENFAYRIDIGWLIEKGVAKEMDIL